MNTFLDQLQRWFYWNSKKNIKSSTFDSYEYRLLHYIEPFFSPLNKQDVDITSEDIQSFVNSLHNKKTGLPLAPNSIHAVVRILSEYFDYGVQQGKLSKNPCQQVLLPKRKQRKITVFTRKEQRTIVKHTIKQQKSKSYLVLTGLVTGMRLGELCSLTWENVDMKNKLIQVTTSSRRIRNQNSEEKTRVITSTPKTYNSQRQIPIPNFLMSYLKELRKQGSEYVFPKTNGGSYDNRSIQKYFNNLMKELTIKGKTFHTLRHTFATVAVESKMDIKTLSIILGHSSVNITMNLYVHPNETYTRKAMENVSLFFIK